MTTRAKNTKTPPVATGEPTGQPTGKILPIKGSWKHKQKQVLSSSFDWQPGDDFLDVDTITFDIDAAKKTIIENPRPLESLPVAWAVGMAVLNVDIDRKRARKAVQDFPLIVGTVGRPRRLLVLDGWHRLYKASKDGLETLPCVILTYEETKEIRGYLED